MFVKRHIPVASVAAVTVIGLIAAASVQLAAAGPPACSITNERNHKNYTTLQAAVGAAHAHDTIVVKGTCIGSGAIVYQDLTILGATNANFPGPPTLDGDGVGPILTAEGGYNGSAPPTFTVTVRKLIITHGSTSGDGGGLSAEGAGLTVSDSIVTGNTGGLGGGIVLRGGALTLNNTVVSGNSAYRGGGIFIYTGTATLNDSTVTGNTAVLQGGGIELLDPIYGDGYPLGTVTLNNSTVTGNVPDDCRGPFVC